MHGIRRARDLVDASHPKSGLSIRVRGDMRRLSLVMAVAALDTYMHRHIIERVYTHTQLPGSLAKLEVPFEHLRGGRFAHPNLRHKLYVAVGAARAPSPCCSTPEAAGLRKIAASNPAAEPVEAPVKPAFSAAGQLSSVVQTS
jgi:hypothetical protein